MGRKKDPNKDEEYWKAYRRMVAKEWRAANPERKKAYNDMYNRRPDVVEKNRLRRKAIREQQRAERAEATKALKNNEGPDTTQGDDA